MSDTLEKLIQHLEKIERTQSLAEAQREARLARHLVEKKGGKS